MSEFLDFLNKPIFLHFLNREIRETEKVTYDDTEILEFITVATLSTQQYIYVGDAIVWEDYDDFPKSVKTLMELEKQGLACFVGTSDNINSFLEKRRMLYQFDRERYPVYFTDKISLMPWATNHRLIEADTTAALAIDLFKIANDFTPVSRSFSEKDKELINQRLEYRRRNGTAVTYSLFSKKNLSKPSKIRIKRQIITSYNQHYLNVMDGRIMAGIPGLEYYDLSQKEVFYSHFQFFRKIYKKLGVLCRDSLPIEKLIFNLLDVRMKRSDFKQLLQEINKIYAGIIYSSVNFAFYLEQLEVDYNESLVSKTAKLWEIAQRICKDNVNFKEGYYKMADNKWKILILAASPLEYKMLRQTARERGYKYVDKYDLGNEEFSYAECNESIDKRCFLAWTDMNSIHSTIAIQQLSIILNPDYVIMGGICAGMRKDLQSIGEIIVADNIHDYNVAKETVTGKVMRGLTIESSRFLKERFLVESYDSDFEVSIGQFISGNTLANSITYIQKVLEDCPDAKGYEMEGSGLMYVCQSFQKKWILAKAVCDWGYDKTDSNQDLAAKNSYSFIFDVIGKEW